MFTYIYHFLVKYVSATSRFWFCSLQTSLMIPSEKIVGMKALVYFWLDHFIGMNLYNMMFDMFTDIDIIFAFTTHLKRVALGLVACRHVSWAPIR